MSEYSRKLKKILKDRGCYLHRQGKGSHEIWKTKTGQVFTLPSNCKSKQLANIILKQIGIKEKI